MTRLVAEDVTLVGPEWDAERFGDLPPIVVPPLMLEPLSPGEAIRRF